MSNRYFVLPSSTRTPNYGALLLMLVLLIVVAPLATRARAARIVEVLFDLVLIAGAYSAAFRGGRRWHFLVLTGLTLAARWGALATGSGALELGSALVTVAWLAAAISLVGKELLEQRKVNTNMIFGAVVVYLLAAVAFAYLYEVLELVQPGAFSGLPEAGNQSALGDALLYFSLVTLTTVGYGDILPVSGLARPLAVLEGVFGTLYLAVMIARLVGLNIAAGISRGKNE